MDIATNILDKTVSFAAKFLVKSFAIVKYFEVLSEFTLPIDNVNCALPCHRLRWQRSSGEMGFSQFCTKIRPDPSS